MLDKYLFTLALFTRHLEHHYIRTSNLCSSTVVRVHPEVRQGIRYGYWEASSERSKGTCMPVDVAETWL